MYEDLYEVERSIDEPKFDAYISNGLDLHSVIPLSNGKESHYIIVDSSINTDFIYHIDCYLRKHFNFVGIEYKYSEEFIKGSLLKDEPSHYTG